MSAVSPHKIYKLGSFVFPTFKQIENLSWAGESKVGSNSLCSAFIGCDGSRESRERQAAGAFLGKRTNVN